MASFSGTGSQRYDLGRELASGGEGSIYEVKSKANLVVKLYHQEVQKSKGLEERTNKIQHMLSHAPKPTEDLAIYANHAYWTWPLEPLFSEHQFVGYVMPKITGVKGEEFLQFSSGFSWQARVVACRNLVVIVGVTHEAGYIIGDLNPRNLFFTPLKSEIILPSITDTDSFQVGGVGSEVLFPCKVQNPEYSAPELIETLAKQRTLEQDYFTLAIVLFQILSLGVHPFSGSVKGVVNQEIRLNILKNRHVLFSKDLIRPKAMLDLTVFPPELLTLFDKTFRKGHTATKLRATTEEWLNVLDTLLTNLETCPKHPQHIFSNHLSACPWCDYAARIKVDPFSFSTSAMSNPPPQRLPQTPRVIRESDSPSGVTPVFQRTATHTVMETGSVTSGPNTLFGPVPDELKPDGEAGHSSKSSPIRQTSPAKKARVTQQPKKQRWPLILFSFFVLALASLAAWLYFNQESPLFTRYVSPWLERFQKPEPSPPVTVFEQEQTSSTVSLTIHICVDQDAPFDCSGSSQSVVGVIPVVQGATSFVTLERVAGENKLTFLAKALPSGRYTLKLDDVALRATHQPCDAAGTNNEMRLELKEDTALTFAYCEKLE